MILASKALGGSEAPVRRHFGLDFTPFRKTFKAFKDFDSAGAARPKPATAVVKRDSRAQRGFEDRLLLTRPDKDAVHVESHGFHLK